jgi:hypothetical protein
MKFSTIFSFLTSLFLFANSSAQNTYNNIDSITGIFKMLIHNTQKEKIILQTDRKLYIAGEKIWFKAFVINSITNKVDLYSKNLFTDLVDDQDSIIAKLVLNNRQLNTNGAFVLPESIKTGFYWLRCYTAKLLAEDPESIFVQPVYILNKSLQDAGNYNRKYANSINKSKKTSPAIHFFPERLTDIPGILSTVVLQITDANNDPLITNGDLLNDRDSLITSFTTSHFGLARITFLHDTSQKYTAIFHVNGQNIHYKLPPTDHSAAQLSVANQTAKSIKAFVTLEDSLSSNYRTIILGIKGDRLCYAAVGSGTYGISIPLNNFPGGIASLLLFNEQQHLLAERKIFINKDNYQLVIKANKKKYSTRDNVTLNIKVTDTDGEPLKASLDASVQDAWLVQVSDSVELNSLPPSDESLLNHWLTLYRDKYSPADIDLLMMTVKSLYGNTTINEVRNDDDEKLINLIGKITDKKYKPVKDRVITVISKNQKGFFTDVDTTKDDGIFKIPLPQNIDSLSLSLQVTDKHGVIRTDDNITVDTFNFPQFATPASLKQQFLAYNINLLASMRKYYIDTAITFQGWGWLKPVTVKAVVKAEPNYDVSRRINSISQILTSDKFRYGGYGAVTNALLMMPGITLTKGDISIWGAITTDKESRPLLVVDGVAMGVASLEYFNLLQPGEVDFIEVLRGGEAGIYGMRGGNGVISVNTRKGPYVMPNEKSNFRTFTPITYHISPQFFMPDYSNQEIKNNKMPDPRTTIYWNGNFTTDPKGQASLNFYTADQATNYTITITGVSAKGDSIYKRIAISRN